MRAVLRIDVKNKEVGFHVMIRKPERHNAK